MIEGRLPNAKMEFCFVQIVFDSHPPDWSKPTSTWSWPSRLSVQISSDYRTDDSNLVCKSDISSSASKRGGGGGSSSGFGGRGDTSARDDDDDDGVRADGPERLSFVDSPVGEHALTGVDTKTVNMSTSFLRSNHGEPQNRN